MAERMTEATVTEGATAIERHAVSVVPGVDQLLDAKHWDPIAEQMAAAAGKALLVVVNTEQDKATAKAWSRDLTPVVNLLEAKRLGITRHIRSVTVDPINERMKSVIDVGKRALVHLRREMDAYDDMLRRKRAEKQREADAEAERRRRAQAASLARPGAEKKTEIVPQYIPEPESIKQDTSHFYRLAYEIEDPDKVPAELCSPDRAKIQARAKEIESQFGKDQKGNDDNLPTDTPGIRWFWKHQRRLG